MELLPFEETNPSKRARTWKPQLSDLPYEILLLILSRLPITSLEVVKCTCKLWHTIINDDMFPELHLEHALKNSGHLYSLTGDDLNLYFAEKALGKTVGIKLPRVVADNSLGDYTFFDRKMLADRYPQYSSCHGLICYCPFIGDIHIFNPIIGEHIRLPLPRYKFKLTSGFGYAPLTKKYKLYCFSCEIRENKKFVFSSGIYTLGDESWREIKGLRRPICTQVYCKGVVYWKIGRGSGSHEFQQFEPGNHVVSLDLETERLRERRINCTNCQVSQSYLKLVGETVAMVLHSTETIKVLMLIDEATDGWVQMYNIPYGVPKELKVNCEFEFFGLWMNQDLYCVSGTDLKTPRAADARCFSYRADLALFSPIELPFTKDADEDEMSAQLVITHVGSLVSPLKIMKAAKQQPSKLG